MNSIFKKNFIALAVLAYALIFVASAQAAFLKPDSTDVINRNAGVAGGLGGYEVNNNDIFSLIQTVISGFLAIIGLYLLIYLLYAGYNWMTARGEEEKVEKAKDTINRLIIGLIIIVGAYAISIFVLGRLQQGTLKSGSSQTSVEAPPPTGD